MLEHLVVNHSRNLRYKIVNFYNLSSKMSCYFNFYSLAISYFNVSKYSYYNVY